MSITIKKIAELAGVSRGTVDRALYNRGRVSKEVSDRIKAIAMEHGYTPSRGGKNFLLTKEPVKIGVVLQSAKSPFVKQLLEGVEKAIEEVSDSGVEVILRQIYSLDAAEQIRIIDELIEEGIQGLAISPVDDNSIQLKVNDVIEKNHIPVMTFNSDITGTKRLGYVGLNNVQSGETAAGLMGMITSGKGKVLIITGYLSSRAHNDRVEGFMRELKSAYPEIMLLGIHPCFDENENAKSIALQMIKANPDLSGIFVAASGERGVCQALEECNLTKQVKLIAYDIMPENAEYVENNTIDFMINQNPLEQGYKPIILLTEYLVSEIAPEKENYFTEIQIKIKQNM